MKLIELSFDLIENIIILSEKIMTRLYETINIFGVHVELIDIIGGSLLSLIVAKFLVNIVMP